MNITIKYLIAYCPECRKKHLEEDVREHNGVLLCRQTESQVERLPEPIPFQVYTFSAFCITIKSRVVLGQVALRAGMTFTLTRPQIVDDCLRLDTKQYGLLSIPMNAIEMEPCLEANQ